jgi:ubiquinone/menaquinone biosynthesis C-methylase UbiE
MSSSPMNSLEKAFEGAVYRIGNTATSKRLFRYWYPWMTRRLGSQGDVVFLNWGYEEDPPLGLPLDAADETNRYSIQLYHQVASQVDLRGKKVLEVSCGHGGGASYIMRTMHPASYTGLDFNSAAVDFCKKRHQIAGLDFVQGDAENLPFPDGSFDAVINVEASHIYPNVSRFFSEVARVLRPGGHFLYTDFISRANLPGNDAALAKSPLRMVSERIIDEQVLRGLKANSPRSNELIDRHLPTALRRFGREFAVVEGSMFFKDLERGELSYRIYCLARD